MTMQETMKARIEYDAKKKRMREIEYRLDELKVKNPISIECAKLTHEWVRLNEELYGED